MKAISGVTTALGVAANWVGQSVAASDFARNLNGVDNRQPESTPAYLSPTALATLGICGLFAAGLVAVKYLNAIPSQQHPRRTAIPKSPGRQLKENKSTARRTNRISNAGSRIQKLREAKVNPPPPSRAKVSKYNAVDVKSKVKKFLLEIPENLPPRNNVQWTVDPCDSRSYIIRNSVDSGMHWKIEPATEEEVKNAYTGYYLQCLLSGKEEPDFEEFAKDYIIDQKFVEKVLKHYNTQPRLVLRALQEAPVTMTRLWKPSLPLESDVSPIEFSDTSLSTPNENIARTSSIPKRKHLSSRSVGFSTEPTIFPNESSSNENRELFKSPIFDAQCNLLESEGLSKRLDKFIADAQFRSIPGGHAHKVGDWLSVPINPENTASGKGRWRILFQMPPGEARIYGIVDYHDNKLIHWREKDIAPALKSMKG